MRRSFALMTAAAVAAVGFAMTPPASSAALETKRIWQTEVCFTVHVIRDPNDYQVSGTLYHNRNRYKGGRTALLLQHGSVSDRSAWDGGRSNVTEVPSMARQLAGAGYDVFGIDRLGYGRSPYQTESGEPGSGWALTMDSYVEMTHELVTQIREGTFRITTGSCDGGIEPRRPASKVVLMGFSGGAGLTEYYATRHHDIDGIVPLMWSNQGVSNRFFEYLFVRTLPPQFAAGKDYVYLFDIGPDGYSRSCEDFLFYADGVSEAALEQLCGPEGYGGDEPDLMPSGDISTQASMQQKIKLTIGNVGPTPALLVFADKDAIFTNAEFGGGEPDTVTPEMEMWSNECNCDVSFLSQENSGHAGWLHDSTPDMTDGILEWLRSRGL